MTTIYTIGYQGKPLSTFIEQLREAGIDAVIDVRLRNTSQLAGYAKRETLSYLLREGFGVAYEHLPELAPTAGILDAYKANEDWTAYEAAFVPLLREREAGRLARKILSRYQRPCLLCAEPTAAHCHRRLVAAYWALALPDIKVRHLQ
jgi:uncharacterized protein (DUF488 family)